MRLTCPTCETAYEVPAGQIPEEGRHVQCSTCHTRWFARPEAAPEPDEDQIIYRLETRSTRRSRPEAPGAVPEPAPEPAPHPAPAAGRSPEQPDGDFFWETTSPAGAAPVEPLRKPVRDQPRPPTAVPAPPRPKPQPAPAEVSPEPARDAPRPAPPQAPPQARVEPAPKPAVEVPPLPPQAHAEVMGEPASAMPKAPVEVVREPAREVPRKTAPEVPVNIGPESPSAPPNVPPREVLRPAALDMRRAELAPPPPRPAEVLPARALPATVEAVAAAPEGPAGHHLRLDVTDAQVEAWEAEEKRAPRSRFARGVFVALVLFGAALGLYVFGGELAAMTPALAPVIEAYVGAVDRLRESMAPWSAG